MTMQLRDGVIEAIGNTPLIKLERVSAETGCTILGKAEFMNTSSRMRSKEASCGPAASSSRAPPAIPVSGLPWSAMPWVFAR
jgi:hypothetical protein